VESNWKQGVVAGGLDSVWTHISGPTFVKGVIRAARLITPFPILGDMMFSLMQSNLGFGYRLTYSRSDLTVARQGVPQWHAADVGTPFPGGIAVETDFPVTVL